MVLVFFKLYRLKNGMAYDKARRRSIIVMCRGLYPFAPHIATIKATVMITGGTKHAYLSINRAVRSLGVSFCLIFLKNSFIFSNISLDLSVFFRLKHYIPEVLKKQLQKINKLLLLTTKAASDTYRAALSVSSKYQAAVFCRDTKARSLCRFQALR